MFFYLVQNFVFVVIAGVMCVFLSVFVVIIAENCVSVIIESFMFFSVFVVFVVFVA